MDLTLLQMKSIVSNEFVDFSEYLAEGSTVSEYDVSKNSGREVQNAKGDMILNVINTKWRLDIVTKPLTQEEIIHFFSEIVKNPKLYLKFNDPFRGGTATALFYRGDRKAEYKWSVYTTKHVINGTLYKSINMAIIGI